MMAGFLHYTSVLAEKKKAGNYNYLQPVPSESVLKSKLKEDQYRVTRQDGTETAFRRGTRLGARSYRRRLPGNIG